MGNKAQLSRKLYARARAAGASQAEAARRAGSRARKLPSLSNAGARLEEEDGVLELIAKARDTYIRGIDDEWTKSKLRMAEMLDHDEWQARRAGADFFAKVLGGYVQENVGGQHVHVHGIDRTAWLEALKDPNLRAGAQEVLRALAARGQEDDDE